MIAAALRRVGFVGPSEARADHWREPAVAESWRGQLLASCESLADADRALAEGWRAAVVRPRGAPRVERTPAGAVVVRCPAEIAPGRLTCNRCRLCDGATRGPVIAFHAHGVAARAAEGALS